jgi:hypothetical protein
MSTYDASRDSRSPTLAPAPTQDLLFESTNDALPQAVLTETAASRTPKSIADMRAEIEGLLDDAPRREFTNTVNAITTLDKRKPKHLEPHHQKLREIVTGNKQIV